MFVEHNLIKKYQDIHTGVYAHRGTYSAIPFYFATCCYPFQLHFPGVDATVRNAVNIVYIWLARRCSRFMRDVLHQSVEF